MKKLIVPSLKIYWYLIFFGFSLFFTLCWYFEYNLIDEVKYGSMEVGKKIRELEYRIEILERK